RRPAPRRAPPRAAPPHGATGDVATRATRCVKAAARAELAARMTRWTRRHSACRYAPRPTSIRSDHATHRHAGFALCAPRRGVAASAGPALRAPLDLGVPHLRTVSRHQPGGEGAVAGVRRRRGADGLDADPRLRRSTGRTAQPDAEDRARAPARAAPDRP